MKKENLTNMLLPKGEWLEALLVAFKAANLELVAAPRSYEYTFVNQALPIVFQAVRSKEVIKSVSDWDTSVNAGFTGTDIAAEARVNIADPNKWKFPLLELNPQAPQPRVYLGSTPNLREKIAQPTLADLEGTTIYTEYPSLTANLILGKVNAKIKAVQGGSEGRWRIDQQNGAIVSIRDTDATMKANEIEPIMNILTAGVLYVESAQISNQDRLRVNDLRERIYLALAGK